MSAAALVTIWVALAVAVAVVQVAALTARRLPTFGAAAGFAMTWRVGPVPVGRIVVLGGWVWLGWHTFVRSHPGAP